MFQLQFNLKCTFVKLFVVAGLIASFGLFVFGQSARMPQGSSPTAQAYFDRGWELLKSGQYLDAAEQYKAGLKLDPTNPVALERLGDSLKKLNQYDDAIVNYTKALQYRPERYQIYDNLAFIYSGQGKFEEAIAASKKAIELFPNNDIAYANLGYSLTKAGRYEESVAPLKRALELTPNDIGLRNNLGEVYFRLGRLDESANILKQAIALKPDEYWPHVNITNVYIAQGKFDAAVNEFKMAVKIDNNDVRSYTGLAFAANQAGLYQDAVDAWTEIIRLKPQDANAYLSRGFSYLALGNGSMSAADANRYLSFNEGNGERSLYALLVKYFGSRLSKNDAEASDTVNGLASKSDLRTWPYPIFRYIRHEISADELIKLAVDGDKKTEVYTYIGLELVVSGQIDQGVTYLQWVKDNGNTRFSEFPVAIGMLKKLTSKP